MPLEDRAKRIGEVSVCLNIFRDEFKDEFGEELEFIENAAEKIVAVYESLLDERIKPFLAPTSHSSRFKIASGMEIATLYVLPYVHKTPTSEARVEVNCLLAATIACHFLFGITYDKILVPYADDLSWERVTVMHLNHLDCLKYSYNNELHSFPLFAIATFWESFSVIIDFMCRAEARQ